MIVRCGHRITIPVLLSLIFLLVEGDQEAFFKINKLNLIWNKAQHSLGPSKLKDLKNDLKRHELDEISLKKMKAHNQDKEGLFEANVRRRLISLLTKYSLDMHFQAMHDSVPSNLNTGQSSQPVAGLNVIFRDNKLDKLWKKAEKAGFSQEQLMVLHEEFERQQDKIDEHHDALDRLDEEIIRLASSGAKDSRQDNSLHETFDEKKNVRGKKSKLPEAKNKLSDDMYIHQSLKKKQSKIKSEYDEIHEKIISGVVDKTKPFEEEAVNELWTEALTLDFHPDELASLREELEHYQTRIKKLKHFDNEMKRNRMASKQQESSDESDEDKHVRRRVKELGQKVDKSRETIKKMITSRREEL